MRRKLIKKNMPLLAVYLPIWLLDPKVEEFYSLVKIDNWMDEVKPISGNQTQIWIQTLTKRDNFPWLGN